MFKFLQILILTLFSLTQIETKAAEPSWGTNGRIGIVGDSITSAYKYAHYLSAYLHLRHPTLNLHIYVVGKGGTNVSAWVADGLTTPTSGSEHYPKFMGPLLLDYVLTKFAYNSNYYNGSYAASEWSNAYNSLITNNILPNGTVPILIGPQPTADIDGGFSPFDDYTTRMISIATSGSYSYSDDWNSLLSVYTNFKEFTAATTDVCTSVAHGFADGTEVYLNLATAPGGLPDGRYFIRDATADTFKLSTTLGGAAVDITSTGSGTQRLSQNWAELQRPGTQNTPATHHSSTGHVMDAYTIIQNLGWGNDVSVATINGSAATLTSSTDCTITSITTNAYNGVDFDRLDARLPWAFDEDSGLTRSQSQRMIPAMIGWQQYLLTVTNLTAGTYDVYINGVLVSSVTHTQLSSGWNMSDLTTGPVFEKCHAVLDAIRSQQGLYPDTLATNGSPNKGMVRWGSNSGTNYLAGLRDGALVAACAGAQTELDSYDSLIWAAAQPETLSFSIRKQGSGAVEAPRNRTFKRKK